MKTGFDLTTEGGRRAAFREAMDPLTKPVAAGGEGLGTNEALQILRRDPAAAKLLSAMGDDHAEPFYDADGADLASAEQRRTLWNERIDFLMRPKASGERLTLDQAIDEMSRNTLDQPLLAAMRGGKAPQTFTTTQRQ